MGRRWFRLKKAVSESQPWQRLGITKWRWKRLGFPFSILDDIFFRVLSVLEAIFLVSALCFFFLCCGCQI